MAVPCPSEKALRDLFELLERNISGIARRVDEALAAGRLAGASGGHRSARLQLVLRHPRCHVRRPADVAPGVLCRLHRDREAGMCSSARAAAISADQPPAPGFSVPPRTAGTRRAASGTPLRS